MGWTNKRTTITYDEAGNVESVECDIRLAGDCDIGSGDSVPMEQFDIVIAKYAELGPGAQGRVDAFVGDVNTYVQTELAART